MSYVWSDLLKGINMSKKIAFAFLGTSTITSVCYAVWVITLCSPENSAVCTTIAIHNLTAVAVINCFIWFAESSNKKRQKARVEEREAWKREHEAWFREIVDVKIQFRTSRREFDGSA